VRNQIGKMDAAFLLERDPRTMTREGTAIARWLAEVRARTPAAEVPISEGLIYAEALRLAGLSREAEAEDRRYLAWAPKESNERVMACWVLVLSLVEGGDADGAERELDAAPAKMPKSTSWPPRAMVRAVADGLAAAGRFERAALRYASLREGHPLDVDDVARAAECWLRLGRSEEAGKLASEAVAALQKASSPKTRELLDRALLLSRQVALVGQPAPGFGPARWWKGAGGPVGDDALRGSLTVVAGWDMAGEARGSGLEGLDALSRDYGPKGVRVVGISRLARFNPCRKVADPDMTEEDELGFYDALARDRRISFPLAIGAYGDDSLLDSWGVTAAPLLLLVGKDGKIAYVRGGTSGPDLAALRAMIDRVLD
jgi:hypothetical protein